MTGCFTEQIRTKREGQVGKIWMVDETCIWIQGVGCYLYRGIDEDGALVDVRLSKTHDMAGPKAFFSQAIELHEDAPDKIVTDGSATYPRASTEELGQDTEHGVRPCTANLVEQSHRPVKHRYYPTLGSSKFEAAQRFCQAVDEVSNFLRPRSQMAEFVSLSVGEASPAENRRGRFMQGVEEQAVLFQDAQA